MEARFGPTDVKWSFKTSHISAGRDSSLSVLYSGAFDCEVPGANGLRCSRICHSRPRWRTRIENSIQFLFRELQSEI